MWHLTKHAKEQMVLRGISEDEVFRLSSAEVVLSQSKKDETVLIATGKVGERFLSVLYNPYTCFVVTVRAASRKERRAYGQKI